MLVGSEAYLVVERHEHRRNFSQVLDNGASTILISEGTGMLVN